MIRRITDRWTLPALVLILASGPAARGQDARPAPKVETDIVYGRGGDTPLKLDLAVPDGPGPFPLVMCLHGGGWVSGDRKSLSTTIEQFAARGFAAAAVEYRLAPSSRFPAQIEDCKAAVRWARANAAKYRLDPDHIGAFGFSAGGHLACLLGLTVKDDALEGQGGNPEHSSRVQAVVSFFGPTDFTAKTWGDDLDAKIFLPVLGKKFEEDPEAYQRFSPVSYVGQPGRPAPPPFLFFHGGNDPLVAPRQSAVLAEKLRAAGGTATVVLYEGEGHGWKGARLRESFNKSIAFFDERLMGPKK